MAERGIVVAVVEEEVRVGEGWYVSMFSTPHFD